MVQKLNQIMKKYQTRPDLFTYSTLKNVNVIKHTKRPETVQKVKKNISKYNNWDFS